VACWWRVTRRPVTFVDVFVSLAAQISLGNPYISSFASSSHFLLCSVYQRICGKKGQRVGREEQFSMSVETILFLGDKIWFPTPRLPTQARCILPSTKQYTCKHRICCMGSNTVSYSACAACDENMSYLFSDQIGSDHDIHTIQCENSNCGRLAFKCVTYVFQPTYTTKGSASRHAKETDARRAQQAEEP
jgi:hypothetical protein